jgi:hypothetical protein
LLITVLPEGTFISAFEDKKSLRRHKTVEIKVFLDFWLVDRRIRIHPDPGGPKSCGSGSGTLVTR